MNARFHPLSFITTLLFVASAVTGCGHHDGDDDINVGTLRQGETRTVEAHAFADSPIRLEECDTAEVVGVRGPDGRPQQLGENVDGQAHGVVSRNARGECETDVDIFAQPDAQRGFYSIEVEFGYFVFGDNHRRYTSGYVDFRVVEGSAPTRTPTTTPAPSATPTT